MLLVSFFIKLMFGYYIGGFNRFLEFIYYIRIFKCCDVCKDS